MKYSFSKDGNVLFGIILFTSSLNFISNHISSCRSIKLWLKLSVKYDNLLVKNSLILNIGEINVSHGLGHIQNPCCQEIWVINFAQRYRFDLLRIALGFVLESEIVKKSICPNTLKSELRKIYNRLKETFWATGYQESSQISSNAITGPLLTSVVNYKSVCFTQLPFTFDGNNKQRTPNHYVSYFMSKTDFLLHIVSLSTDAMCIKLRFLQNYFNFSLVKGYFLQKNTARNFN